jgi:hypothetical protein
VVTKYLMGLDSPLSYNISSTIIGTGFGTVWRFWSFRRWVFIEDANRDQEAAEVALV